MKIPQLVAHEELTDTILDWTSDWLAADEFDRKAASFSASRAMPRGKDDYLLPSWTGNNGGQLADFIFLAQVMASKGILSIKERNGVISYRRA